MRVTCGLAGKITHQQCIIQVDILWYRHPHGVTIARRNWHGFAFRVFHLLGVKLILPCGVISSGLSPTVNLFYQHGRQFTFGFAGEFADKLLTLETEAVFVVLIVVMCMAAQEPFGVTTMRRAFQRFQQLRVERFTGCGIINGFTIDLRGTCTVIVRLGAAFDLQECTPICVRRSTWAIARKSFEFMM